MRVRMTSVIIIAIGLLLVLPSIALAEPSTSDQGAPLLTPVGELVAVRGRMLTMESKLVCQGDQCQWQVEQTWIIENTDKSQDRTLLLMLADASQPLSAMALSDEQGNVLTPQESGLGASGSQWSLVIRAGKRAQLTLRYALPNQSGRFTSWALAGDQLGAWGGLDSARIHLALPDLLREDAFVRAEPSNYRLVGRDLTWDYENIASYADFELTLLAPPTAAALQTLAAAEDHLGRAELLASIQADAEQAGYAWPDADAEIGAAIQLAIAADPSSTAALLALAQYYEKSATSQPDLSTNYLVLAARALERVVTLDAANSQASTRLQSIYMQASRAASQSGDLAGALEYMSLAKDHGAQTAATETEQAMLALQFAASLAGQGQPSKAIEQVSEQLSPAALGDIAHYAPPFGAAETRLTYTPSRYQSDVLIQSYGPLAQGTLAKLEHTVDIVNALAGWSAEVAEQRDGISVTMALEVTSPEQVQAASESLTLAIHDDTDMLSTLLSLPWSSSPEACHLTETPWSRQFRFVQHLDTRTLAARYADQADYAGWRLAEIRARIPETEVERLEQQLVIAALDEQVTIWRQLPASCYWVVRVDADDLPKAESPVWIVDWDQTETLQTQTTEHKWLPIAASTGAVAAFCILMALAALWRKEPRA